VLEAFVVHSLPGHLEVRHDARVALNGGPCHDQQGLISHESVHALESPHLVSDGPLQSHLQDMLLQKKARYWTRWRPIGVKRLRHIEVIRCRQRLPRVSQRCAISAREFYSSVIEICSTSHA